MENQQAKLYLASRHKIEISYSTLMFYNNEDECKLACPVGTRSNTTSALQQVQRE